MSVAPLQFLLLVFAGWVNRRQVDILEYLQEENRVLREQLGDRHLRFSDAQRRRLAAKGRAIGRRALEQLAGLVTPDTILRWYRELIARKYDGTAQREGYRPGTAAPLQRLVVRFATENPSWGYTRIRGALRNLGHELGRNTIKRILAEHGLEPAPKRGKAMPWKTFLLSGQSGGPRLVAARIVSPRKSRLLQSGTRQGSGRDPTATRYRRRQHEKALERGAPVPVQAEVPASGDVDVRARLGRRRVKSAGTRRDHLVLIGELPGIGAARSTAVAPSRG